MAYIHKATVYFVDSAEEYLSAKDIADEMRCYDNLPVMKVGSSETKEFDWDDNVVVNKIDCTPERAEEFFQNVKPKKTITKYWYSVVLDTNKVISITQLDSSKDVQNVEAHETAISYVNDDGILDFRRVCHVDVEAESSEQAECTAKYKVLNFLRKQAEQTLSEIERRYFPKV